jgi:hypothetical protein
MPMDPSLNDPETKIVDGVAKHPDGTIDYEYCYTDESGHSRLIPPEEILPMTPSEISEVTASIEAAIEDGEIDINDFSVSEESAEKMKVEWAARREAYFRERGTTYEEFVKTHSR